MNALQSDCCSARFMLNDILDGLRGNSCGADFFDEYFLPKFVETFLAQREIKTQFLAVERLDRKALSPKKVLDAVLEGFETAKKEFEACSVMLMPKIAARLNKRFKSLFRLVKVEQEEYMRSKKLRNFEEESQLSSLVLTARDLAEELSRVGHDASADELRDAHAGIQYCIQVPHSLMCDGWRHFS